MVNHNKSGKIITSHMKKRTKKQNNKDNNKYKLCNSEVTLNKSLNTHLSSLEHSRYKKIIKTIYEIYTKNVISPKLQAFVYQSEDCDIANFNIFNTLPNTSSTVRKLKSRYESDQISRLKISKKDIEEILEEPNISTNNLIFTKFSNVDIILDLIHNNYTKYSIKYDILLPDKTKKKYEIYIYSKIADDATNMIKFGSKIIHRVLFMNYLLNTNILPSRIDIYLTKFKKTLDYNKSGPIDSSSVNSAVTDGHNITIFREEEALKCLIHELVHFHSLDEKLYNFDMNNMDVNVLLRRLKVSHNIDLNYEHRITESYTECLATLFSCILSTADTFSNYQEHKLKFNNKCMKEIIKCLSYEIGFSFLQIAKILKYFEYDRFEDLLKLNSNGGKKTQPLTQKTDLFSYYILKTYLIINIFDLLDEIGNPANIHGLSKLDIMGFVEDSIEKIMAFNTVESRILISGVNKYMNKYRATKKKNLRMTCLD